MKRTRIAQLFFENKRINTKIYVHEFFLILETLGSKLLGTGIEKNSRNIGAQNKLTTRPS